MERSLLLMVSKKIVYVIILFDEILIISKVQCDHKLD
jgi:hypothetical protein